MQLEGVSKQFRSHWTFSPIEALKQVSFEISAGDTFGYLGHNGAGKTTTIKCILGLIRKNSGTILFAGEPLERASQRQMIGYLPELPYFYDHLTVGETLQFFASLCKLKDAKIVDETLERVRLSDRKNALVGTLSKGLQQRLGFAQAIINRPKLLLLDEPFSGLDPLGRKEFRELILELKHAGTTILLSSHILSDVENICNRVSIMTQGEIRTVFSVSETAALFGQYYELAVPITDATPDVLTALAEKSSKQSDEAAITGTLRTFLYKSDADAHTALHRALHAQLRVERFENVAPSLEEIFVQVTQTHR